MSHLTIRTTNRFSRWLAGLGDTTGRARILVRLDRLAQGHFGDHRVLGAGLIELRLDVGPGYRIYLTLREDRIVILLAGGHKGTQRRDIAAARRLIESLDDSSKDEP